MNSTENLFYALGEFAFAVALADGKIQKEENDELHNILAQEFKNQEYDYSEIIFEILRKDELGKVQDTYNWALKELKLNSHYLSPEMKQKFVRVIEKVAEVFPPTTLEEAAIIEKFKQDIGKLKGDPIYYAQHQISK